MDKVRRLGRWVAVGVAVWSVMVIAFCCWDIATDTVPDRLVWPVAAGVIGVSAILFGVALWWNQRYMSIWAEEALRAKLDAALEDHTVEDAEENWKRDREGD